MGPLLIALTKPIQLISPATAFLWELPAVLGACVDSVPGRSSSVRVVDPETFWSLQRGGEKKAFSKYTKYSTHRIYVWYLWLLHEYMNG